MKKGQKIKEETREKMRLAKLGKKRAPFSMATKEKMSIARKDKKRPPFSDDWKMKISNGMKGRILSDEVKKNHSIGAKKAGCGKWMLGKKLSKDTKLKLSNIKKGENHPNWKGGGIDYQKKQAPRPKPEICEVCGTFAGSGKAGIHYDHDHKTGLFRGWLCGRCNVALGMVKDNSETLVALSEYLIKSRIK